MSQKHVVFSCDTYPILAAVACELLRQSDDVPFTFEPVALNPDEQALLGQITRSFAQRPVELQCCKPQPSSDYYIYLGASTEDHPPQNHQANMVLHWDITEPEEPQNAASYSAAISELKARINSFIMVHQTHLTPALIAPTQFYKQLGDELRLKSILLIMRHKELCVCELMAALDESQPKISRHLAQLRKAGILLDRRQGQWVYYRIHPNLPDWMQAVLETTLSANADFLQQAQKQLINMVSRPNVC